MMNDRQIYMGLRQNDRATTEYVYKTLAPPVFKYVLSNNGSREEAKDLFQETYIKVLHRIQEGKYTDFDKFEAYFITVARNTWIDQLKLKKNKVLVDPGDSLWQRADDSDEDALLQLVLHDRRLEALHTVWDTWTDTECRRILHQFHYEQVRTKDIAAAENVAQNAILQRLFKCRSKLFKLVQKHLA